MEQNIIGYVNSYPIIFCSMIACICYNVSDYPLRHYVAMVVVDKTYLY